MRISDWSSDVCSSDLILLGTVTGIGGGTIRDLLLDAHPVLWVERPQYLGVCILVSIAVFFTAHLAASRYRLILWLDALGLGLFATAGAEKAASLGEAPLVAITMGRSEEPTSDSSH